jgi:hypothetical protein
MSFLHFRGGHMDSIDYSRVLQPQEDWYDIDFYKTVKKKSGFKKIYFDYVNTALGHKVQIWKWRDLSVNSKYIDSPSLIHHLHSEATLACPLIYNNILELVDVFTPIECVDGNEYSCQHSADEFPHAWIIMAPLTHDPTVSIRNLYHELMHWKLTALGFGKGPADFLDTTDEFVLNDKAELYHSIVNSYPDTAQPSVGNKPTGRPISACIHAYASFLGEIDAALQFVKYNPEKYYIWMGYAKKWERRLDESLEALLLNAKTTPKGAQLLMGLYKWSHDVKEDYKDTIKTLERLVGVTNG